MQLFGVFRLVRLVGSRRLRWGLLLRCGRCCLLLLHRLLRPSTEHCTLNQGNQAEDQSASIRSLHFFTTDDLTRKPFSGSPFRSTLFRDRRFILLFLVFAKFVSHSDAANTCVSPKSSPALRWYDPDFIRPAHPSAARPCRAPLVGLNRRLPYLCIRFWPPILLLGARRHSTLEPKTSLPQVFVPAT